MLSPLVTELVLLAVRVADETPEPEDVKAGWTAFAIFLLLIGAVVLLGFSLTKHLRRAQAAEKAGLYGSDQPAEDGEDSDAESEPHQAP